jgi:hypothetical protein
VGAVAERDQDFNATDVIRQGLASNRFLAACSRNDFVSVALERGGRGYHLEVFQYQSGVLSRRWKQFVNFDGTASINLLEAPDER